ncbi:MAG: hypothetical protein KatS3mg115_2401 [Candidatus Poribacteria bacterium]|nr:MAG: hypothetical protein KatS3mg115_2401 [Candidatus Poribacteria bacterium]
MKAGKILSSDMYGNIEFLDSSGEILQLKKGRGAGECARDAGGPRPDRHAPAADLAQGACDGKG